MELPEREGYEIESYELTNGINPGISNEDFYNLKIIYKKVITYESGAYYFIEASEGEKTKIAYYLEDKFWFSNSPEYIEHPYRVGDKVNMEGK